MTMSREDLVALTRELPIPTPWDRDAFIGNIAAMRDRPIRLLPADTDVLSGAGSALWLAGADEDVIIHGPGLSDAQIDLAVCHKIGHMLLGHDSVQTGHDEQQPSGTVNYFLPDIDPTTVRTVLGGNGFSAQFEADQELDAEALAHMILPTAR